MSGAHKRGSDGASNVDQEISTSSLDIQAMQSLNKLPQNVDPNVEKLLAALHEAIATQHSREITALEELNKGLKVKLRSFEADNKSMKVELQTCRAELEEQQPLIIRMCDEISVLTANLVEAMAISKRCEAHISEKNDILAENAALRSALLAAEQANQSETDFDLMVAKNRRLQSEITRLQAIVASTARKEDKLKMMHRSTHELNEQLMEENSTLSRQILELQQEVDDLQDEVVPLKVDHETKCVKLAPVGKGPFDTPDPDPVPIPIPAFEYSVDCDDKAGKGGQPLKESHKERLLKNGEVSSAVSENAGEGEGSDADSEDSDSTDEVTEEVEEVLGVSVTMEVSAPLVEEGAVRRRRESQQGWDDSSGREREGGLVVYDGDEVRRGYYTDAAAEGDQLPSHNVQEQEPISSIPLQPRTLNATYDRCEDGSGGSWQVLLSNVPLYITGRKVQDLAQTCGAVASVQVAEGNSSQFRIAFHSAQGAQRAVAELDGYLLNGEHLRCRKYEEFPVPPPPPPSPTTATHSNNARKKVYLRYDGGKEDVRREVEKCGEVNSISYQRSEDWFEVIFRHPLGAEEAVKRLHKYVLFRRVMHCYHSWDKDLLRTDMMSSDVAAGTVSVSVADVRRHDHDCDRDRVTSFAASPAAYPPRTHASREEDALVLNDPMLQQYKPYQDTTTTAEEDEAPNRYERVFRGDNIFPHPPHSARAPSRGRIITSDDTATAVARNITVTKSGNAGRNQRGGVQARRAREAGRQDHSVRGAGGGGGRGSGRGSGGGGRRGSEGGASGGMKRSVTKAYLEEGSSQSYI